MSGSFKLFENGACYINIDGWLSAGLLAKSCAVQSIVTNNVFWLPVPNNQLI